MKRNNSNKYKYHEEHEEVDAKKYEIHNKKKYRIG